MAKVSILIEDEEVRRLKRLALERDVKYQQMLRDAVRALLVADAHVHPDHEHDGTPARVSKLIPLLCDLERDDPKALEMFAQLLARVNGPRKKADGL